MILKQYLNNMIDNFELIKPLFYFNEDNNMFFHLEIFRRKKDHKGENVTNYPIKSYLVKSREHLEKIKEEVIFLCEHYGARAYINVAPKSFEDVNKAILYKLANLNYTNNLFSSNPYRITESAIGEIKSVSPKWIIDIDDISIKDTILEWLDRYFYIDVPPHYYTRDYYLKITVPTVQGCHLITLPFNTKEFSDVFPNIDIHKNNGTLLYYPKSLEKCN